VRQNGPFFRNSFTHQHTNSEFVINYSITDPFHYLEHFAKTLLMQLDYCRLVDITINLNRWYLITISYRKFCYWWLLWQL